MDQGIKSIAGTLNFEATLLGAINELDRETDWRIYNVEQGDFAELAGRVANRRFRSIPVNFVLFVSARYYFAPDLNQIVLRSEARIYSRSKIKGRLPATYTRRYEYLSKSKGNILRPFRTGEKEALIADVEARFTALVEQYPANRKAYSKERRHAIRILKKRDVIPPIMALSEGWPGLSFTDELVRATDQLEQMLKVDLHDFPPSRPVKGHFIPFNGLSSSGKPKKLRGHIVDKLGTNTVYRDRYGDMYSVP